MVGRADDGDIALLAVRLEALDELHDGLLPVGRDMLPRVVPAEWCLDPVGTVHPLVVVASIVADPEGVDIWVARGLSLCTRLSLVSIVILQPCEQLVQIELVWSRSQTRALWRKSLERSAPTGQISTILPAQFESSSPSSKKVSMTERLPRCTTPSARLPPISRMKRTQRVHMIQRLPS